MCEGGYNILRREESKKPEFLIFINVGEITYGVCSNLLTAENLCSASLSLYLTSDK